MIARVAYQVLTVALVIWVCIQGLASLPGSTPRIVGGTDAEQYDVLARNLVADRGFSSSGPPFEPTIYREPAYPVLVAASYRLFGMSPDPVAVLQVGLLALTAGLTVSIGARLFHPVVGLGAGLIVGLSPETQNYAGWLLTETLFGFLIAATLSLALWTRLDGKSSGFMMVGVALGLSMLTRAVAVSLVVPLALLLAWSVPARQTPGRFVKQAGLVIAAAAVVTAPWLVRNWLATGRPSWTSRSGVALIRRAASAAEPIETYALWTRAALWMAFNPLSNQLVPIERFQWGPDPEDNEIWDFHVNTSVRNLERYDLVCRAAPDWESCAADLALAFIRDYPIGYASQTLFELVRLQFAPLPSQPGGVHNLTIWGGLISLGGLVLKRRLNRPRAVVLGTTAVYLGLSGLVDAQVRYIVPLLPVYAVFGAAGLWWALASPYHAIARRFRPAEQSRPGTVG